MKAEVKKDMCIGCGLCADLYPAVFRMIGGGVAEAIADELPEKFLAEVEDAIEQCPNEAIFTINE